MIAAVFAKPRRFWLGVLGAALIFGGLGWAGDRPPPEALWERARALEQEIRELSANGHLEQAERLELELREVRENAERLERERPEGDPDRPPLPEVGAEARAMIRKMRQLQAEGREEAAAELRQELARRQRGPEWRPVPPRGEPGPPEEMERRLHHLQVAIDNLHAAGMPEVAQRLEREAQRRRQQLEAVRQPEPPEARLGAELIRLRAELEELRANLAELRQHVRQLHRERE